VWWGLHPADGYRPQGWPQLHASLQEAVVAVVDQLSPDT
jgi:hypothetical protein